MKQQTAVEWLYNTLCDKGYFKKLPVSEFKEALQMEKEQKIDFAEYVARYPDKNRNHLGQMLHAKSKYDGAERTIDLLEQYYNETYGDTTSHNK